MRRYVHRIDKKSDDPTTSVNEVVSFDDYDYLKAVSWVGENGQNIDVELKSHDGRTPIIDSVPLDYFKIGNGRQEMLVETPISNNSVRVATSFETGQAAKGALVFTLERRD